MNTMRMSISAHCVVDMERDAVQWTINVRVRNRITNTLTLTAADPRRETEDIARFLVSVFMRQADIQRPYDLISETNPWQDELPF